MVHMVTRTDEIIEKRDWHSKHYNTTDPLQYQAEFSVNAVHYKDKLGNNAYKDVDISLVETASGWEITKNIYNVQIPKYADEEITFLDLFLEKNQSIKIKALCNHVLGIKTQINGKEAILYENAYGPGFDLILLPTPSSLQKLVRIRKDFCGSSDLAFDFEVINHQKLPVKRVDSSFKGYDFLMNGAKTLDTDKSIVFGGSSFDEVITIRSFRVYEEKRSQRIDVEFFVQDNRTIFRKIVPGSFLASATNDVFTDANLNVRQDYDSWWYSFDTDSFDDQYEGVGSIYVENGHTNVNVASAAVGHIANYLSRYFCLFNTSSLGQYAAITDGYIYNFSPTGPSTTTLDIGITSLPPTGTAPSWDLMSKQATGNVEIVNRIGNISGFPSPSSGSWLDGGGYYWPLNATGRVYIARTAFEDGYSPIAMCGHQDLDYDPGTNTPDPGAAFDNYVYLSQLAAFGNQNWGAYLNVTYTNKYTLKSNLQGYRVETPGYKFKASQEI